MFQARVHEHPRNSTEVVYGQQLEPQDTVESIDVYSDESGVWKSCKSFHGFKAHEIIKVFRIVIRPVPQSE